MAAGALSARGAPPRRAGASGARASLPGFNLAFGYAVVYLSLIVLIPLAALILRASAAGLEGFWAARDRAAGRGGAAGSRSGSRFAAAFVDSVFGLLVAWVLTRYRFPGRKFLDAAVDLPFALPTAVAGIALAALYAPNGWIGGLVEPLGLKIAFTPLGIFVALVFVGLPFAVRTVAAAHRRDRPRARGGGGDARRRPRRGRCGRVLLAAAPAGDPDRLRARLRAGGRRIRLGDLHRRQHPLRLGDRAAAHHHQARGVQLYAAPPSIATIMLAISFLTLLVDQRACRPTAARRFGHG